VNAPEFDVKREEVEEVKHHLHFDSQEGHKKKNEEQQKESSSEEENYSDKKDVEKAVQEENRDFFEENIEIHKFEDSAKDFHESDKSETKVEEELKQLKEMEEKLEKSADIELTEEKNNESDANGEKTEKLGSHFHHDTHQEGYKREDEEGQKRSSSQDEDYSENKEAEKVLRKENRDSFEENIEIHKFEHSEKDEIKMKEEYFHESDNSETKVGDELKKLKDMEEMLEKKADIESSKSNSDEDEDGKGKHRHTSESHEHNTDDDTMKKEDTDRHHLFRRAPPEIKLTYDLADQVPTDSICIDDGTGTRYTYLSKGLYGQNSFFVYGKNEGIFHPIAYLVLDQFYMFINNIQNFNH